MVHRVDCNDPGYLAINQRPTGKLQTMCFANAGYEKVLIADVQRMWSGNNSGYVITNKGRFDFRKGEPIEFLDKIGTVTIWEITID